MPPIQPASAAPICNLDDLELKPWGHGDKFKAQHAQISQRLGARLLGYGVVSLPPGKRAWPYHAHLANEEMFFVLSGEGTLRLNGAEYPLRAGDVIAVPPGPQSAHQIYNSSAAELRYLAVSTRLQPEVVQYPDSQKVAFMALAETADGPQQIRGLYAADSPQAGYWDGEG